MDNNSEYPQAIPVKADEHIIQVMDPLMLKEEDSQLVRIVDNYDTKSKGHFAKVRLRDRQDRNFGFLFGREGMSIDNLLNKRSIYSDNVLYEIESTLKPLATSKDPDIPV